MYDKFTVKETVATMLSVQGVQLDRLGGGEECLEGLGRKVLEVLESGEDTVMRIPFLDA